MFHFVLSSMTYLVTHKPKNSGDVLKASVTIGNPAKLKTWHVPFPLRNAQTKVEQREKLDDEFLFQLCSD